LICIISYTIIRFLNNIVTKYYCVIYINYYLSNNYTKKIIFMKLKKEITLIISSLGGGGSEKVCITIGNGLVKLGWKVNLVVLNLDNQVFLKQLSNEINLIKLNKKRTRYVILPLLRYIYFNKPSLFLAFNYEITILLIFLKILLRFKYKIIARNNNTISHKLEEFKKQNFWIKYIFRNLFIKFYDKSDHVINQCSSMKDDIIKIYPKIKKKTSVIYNPISENILDYVKNYDINKVKKKNYLLCVGRLEHQKAFHYAIEGFARISDKFPYLRLKIIGQGSQLKELKKVAAEFGVEEKVDFEGFQKEIIPYYLNAKVTILTSQYEGFPNVLIESIVLGTPVVSFDCSSGPSEIINDGINGYLVKYRNVEDLQNKLLVTIKKKFSTQKMSLTVKKYKSSNIIKLYDKLLNFFV
jgi:glycosyltransferase involved in cell wall biosynthesis